MAGLLTRRLAIAVAIAALALAGAAVALGAGGGGSAGAHGQIRAAGARHGLLAAAAGYLGLTTAQLRGELRSGRTLAQVAGSTSGRTEAGLVAALVNTRDAQLTERITAFVRRSRTAASTASFAKRSRRARAAASESVLGAASAYLGLTRKQLRQELRAGKSLTQIAQSAPGKSPQGLSEAILAAAAKRLSGAARNHAG